MNEPPGERFWLLTRPLAFVLVAGVAVQTIASIRSDYNRAFLVDLAVLLSSFVVLSLLVWTRRPVRPEFWGGFVVGGLLVTLTIQEDSQSARDRAGGIVQTTIGAMFEGRPSREDLILGATKFQCCACNACVSLYQDHLVNHRRESARSALGLCAAVLAGAAACGGKAVCKNWPLGGDERKSGK